MLGSDYCFDMGYTRPRRIIERLGLHGRPRILRGNAAKLCASPDGGSPAGVAHDPTTAARLQTPRRSSESGT